MISTDALQVGFLVFVNKGLSLTIVNEGSSLTIFNETTSFIKTIVLKNDRFKKDHLKNFKKTIVFKNDQFVFDFSPSIL